MFKPDLKKYAEKLAALGRNLTAQGGEIHDPTPKAPPIGFVPRIPLHERIREMVRSEQMALLAEQQGKETFAEANDFGPDDDDFEDFPRGRHEKHHTNLRDWGADIQRSKAEQRRLAEAEDRLASKIGRAVRATTMEDDDLEPVAPRRSRRQSPSVRSTPEDAQDRVPPLDDPD